MVRVSKESKPIMNGFPQNRSIFPDIRVTIVDSIAESSKVASAFIVEGTQEKEFRGIPARQ